MQRRVCPQVRGTTLVLQHPRYMVGALRGSCGDEVLAKPQMHSAVHGGHHPVHGLLHRSDLVRRKLVMLAMAAWHGYGLALRDRHCAATMVGLSGGHAPRGPAQPLQDCALGPIGGLSYRAEQARRKLLIMVVFGWQRLCRRPRGAKASTATCARAPQVAEGPRSDHSRVVFWVPLEVCCTVLKIPGANSSSWSSLVGSGFADDPGAHRQVRQRVPVHPRWPRGPGRTSVAGVLVPRPPPDLPVLY